MATLKKDPKETYEKHGGKTIDIDFSFRRNRRQPLDESSLPKDYKTLEKLLKDPTSNIYKGQIVVTDDKEYPKDISYFTPYLIKSPDDKSYIADRLLTVAYLNTFLGSDYVKKQQLGTKYTGVGIWVDGIEDGEVRTTTYSEIFNDYVNNTIGFGNNEQNFNMYAHVEGSCNSTNSGASHVEGVWNIMNGNSYGGHIEGIENRVGKPEQDVMTNALKGVHVEGIANVVEGSSSAAHIEGSYNTIINANNSHVGGLKNNVSGDLVFAHGTYLTVGENGVGFGTYNTVEKETFIVGAYNASYANSEYSFVNGTRNSTYAKASHAEGEFTQARGESSHTEGISTVAYNIGSHAEGNKTSANGDYSHAEGISTQANAIGTHSEGNNTVAGTSANYSHAEGDSTTTVGLSSHSEGKGTKAEGNYSHAEGNITFSKGESSHSEGSSTYAEGASSHSEGSSTYARGNYSHAEGYNTSIDTSSHYSHVEGNNNNIVNSQYSHAEGSGNTIQNSNYAHVEGNTNTVTKDYAHAEGYQNVADGKSSHAEGNTTQALGETSHSEGSKTIANEANSHAEGYNTHAMGIASHSEGKDTVASGNYSHTSGDTTSTGAGAESANAEGIHTKANGYGSHSEGYYTVSGFTKSDQTLSKATHAEGSYTYAAGDYSHAEGFLTQSYGEASKSSGYATIVRGDYAMSHGFYSTSPNKYEISFGSFNRAYTSSDDHWLIEGSNKVPNEFARIAGNYIPGRYPDGIKDSNKSTVAYYDDSYQSIFTIGNGTSDNKYSVDPLSKVSYTTANGNISYKDAGQQVKEGGRHNIMDIRKNGQMYYDGGMIIGGETVAPVSYSYVNSLGPTAYLTTVMRALLVQPEYYRPSLQYAIWYTGAGSVTGATSSNSVGWAYFQSDTTSNGVCEVGMTTQLKLGFRAFNVGVDKPKRIDPLYGTPLGNMLGYSTGVTNVTYQIINSNTNVSAQTFTTKEGNELLAGMKEDNIRYQAKRLDLKNYDYGAYYCAYCNAVDNRGPFYNANADASIKNTIENDVQNYSAGLYSSQQVLTTNLKLDKEGTFTVWKATSYTFNPATQMYFQQLMEKNTYIPDDGFAPLDKFGKTTVTSTAKFTIHARYRIYYGVTNAVPSDKWKDWTQADLLNSTTYGLGSGGSGRGQVYGNENVTSNSAQDVTQGFSSTVKTCWFAFPEDIYKLGRYNTAAVPSDKFMWYRNAMNAESSLDTGRITDAISSARPMYEYVTNNPISPSGLKYHIVAVSAPGGITKGTWGFRFVRK